MSTSLYLNDTCSVCGRIKDKIMALALIQDAPSQYVPNLEHNLPSYPSVDVKVAIYIRIPRENGKISGLFLIC